MSAVLWFCGGVIVGIIVGRLYQYFNMHPRGNYWKP
jgi:hypothetical protein